MNPLARKFDTSHPPSPSGVKTRFVPVRSNVLGENNSYTVPTAPVLNGMALEKLTDPGSLTPPPGVTPTSTECVT